MLKTDDNFKTDILKMAGDQPAEAIVIGEMGWGDSDDDDKPAYKHVVGRVLSWAEAAPIVDYNYGFGDCQAITAWTKDWVIFVSQYDCSPRIERVPRNPIAHLPQMPGG